MTAEKANKLLADIRENIRKGIGPHSLAAQREQNEAQREADAQAKDEESRKGVSFSQFFEQEYLPVAEARQKSVSIVAEKALYTKWLKPVLAEVPLVKIDVLHLDRLMLNMTKEGNVPPPSSMPWLSCPRSGTSPVIEGWSKRNPPLAASKSPSSTISASAS